MLVALTLMSSRIAIAAIFAVSATGKALDVAGFRESVSEFRLLPTAWINPAVWTFLCLEFAVVIALIIGDGLLLPGFVLAACLLLIFSAALSLALLKGARTTCNCFGRTQERISPYDLARNAMLLVCSLAGCWAVFGPSKDLSVSESILALLMTSCLIVFVSNVRTVLETLRQPFRIGGV